MVKNYGSDVSREQFEIIREDLEKAKKATRPRKVDLYDIFRAVLYILKTGSQWRNLPKDFPNWKLVYYYFTVWKKPKENRESVLEEILQKISIKNLNCRREEAKTSFVIIDSQSVKNTDTAKEKGYDTGKKILEIKRHIAVDSQGLPHAISVTTADITDRNGASELFKINKNNLTDVKNIIADFGYSGENFASEVQRLKLLIKMMPTNFPLFPSVGLSNVLLLGLKNFTDFGKIVNVFFCPVYLFYFFT